MDHLGVTHRDGVLHVRMAHPPVNAFTVALLEELRDAFLTSGPRPRVIVLSSEVGGIFAAGGDLRFMAQADEPTSSRYVLLCQEVYGLLERSDQVSIAAIDGACLGGGLEIALAADIRVASPTSRLGLPEASLGILAGGGAIHRLVRATGQGVARDLLLAGEPISGATAHGWGLVSRLSEDPVAEALRLAARIAELSPDAMAATKSLAIAASTDDLAAGLADEHRRWLEVRRGTNAQEGLTAFAERREARFVADD
ncbi:enoyl-CoA hydratase-related protein [Nocardioides sp. LHD-245]|uniref:enoyl-CoA hydratase/isomerase family protein n=1 Tax=Nocardioides sp. LHD-245 TaxID=3051387 RepID=UPI0027E1A35E|nr:enoyl-CoA hydratase-related protein [Nocardioides sp. LHD-245]